MDKNLNTGAFKAEDLKLCDFQYEIKHNSIDDFKVGEEVFLKSNPETPMKVYGFSEDKKSVLTSMGDNKYSFPPECLLQYKYAGLLIAKRKHKICLD